jgi:hypothetical protein
MKKSAWILLCFALLLGSLKAQAQTGTPATPSVTAPPKVADMAPDFTLPSMIAGKLVDMKLSDLRGKSKVLLAFYVFDFTGG